MTVCDMAQYEYKKENGTFDYEQYVERQSLSNVRKLRCQWVIPQTIDVICHYLQQCIPAPKFGLCHGTRRGMEQALFKERLAGCEVLGTEISRTAGRFPDTVQWDFHKIKPEWVNAADFVYSNSLDHAYDPHLAVDKWMQSLTDPGYCFVEWWQLSDFVDVSSSVDCFKATIETCKSLFTEWGRAADIPYGIVSTLTNISGPGRIRHQEGVVFVLAKDKE